MSSPIFIRNIYIISIRGVSETKLVLIQHQTQKMFSVRFRF